MENTIYFLFYFSRTISSLFVLFPCEPLITKICEINLSDTGLSIKQNADIINFCKYIIATMGVARILFRGGTLFQKNFQKIFQKMSKNIQKNIKKYSKKILKNFKKISKRNFGKFWKIFLRNFRKMHYFHERPRDFFRGEVRSTKGGLVRGSPRGGFRGGQSPPDAGEVFKKFVKNQWKI